ncbi:Mucin-associated surface protein (MASP) [Trypanosoma cruzi]|uniref:Mucin-associated surface protein (MASP) n=1 Tax=Trypanosoma cruzi TaxID=5693 RepID=A0A7J6XVA7_TRYCR|nr:Mucin-associated surface protein (MASP) [Trypanosoma cruzi]
MLSRVAAVKAPRTHNRRRVTGSSGRRREGRESEPQRPNMSRHVFTSAVLLLVVMMCCGISGAASTEEVLSSPRNAKRKLFFWKDVEIAEKKTVVSLRVPSLVEMDGDVFAVAEAQCRKEGKGGVTGIASKLLTSTGESSKEELDKNKLKTQVLEECSSEEATCASQNAAEADSQSKFEGLVARPTTVVHGSDIYMLAGIYVREGTAGSDDHWGLLLARGNVSGENNEKRIYWNYIEALPSTSNIQRKESLKALIGGGGSGVKMNDDTLVFPVEGMKANEDGAAGETNAISLIIYSKGTKSWTLSKGISADGCSDPSVVEWEKDKLMMMTACDGGRRRVYESGDKGESWTEALGTLSRVWGNKHKGPEKGVGSGFITAKIDGVDKKKVMLITLPVYSNKNEVNRKGELHLWLTDNTHIVDIGPVSKKDHDVAASSLLYKSAEGENKKEELIALYEKEEGNEKETSHGMVSVRLTEQLQRVKEVLATWKEVDERVSQMCIIPSAAQDLSTDTACSPDKITDGLVGFLSGNFSGKTWRDEYLGVDATVMSGAAAATETSDNGVKFQGAWAEWPVGRQGENQLYHFANYKFTLVATVSIDGEPKKDTPIPLMGVRAGSNGENKLMELSYNKEKKWQVLCGGKTIKEHGSTLGAEKTQHVVILLLNGNHGSAYVDGQRVGGDTPCALGNTDSKEISHFYIGGDEDKTRSQEGVSVTVTNVLLYNRPLDEAVIGVLNPNKISTSRTLVAGATGEGTARPGKAHGDGSTDCGSGLLPSLLLLLGLWGFAAL